MSIEPDPTNPLDILVKLALAMFFGLAAFFGAGGDTVIDAGSQSSGAPVSGILTVIESVEPLIRESMPPQVSLNVSGYHPDGCTFPVIVDQVQDGKTITVTIYRQVPPDVLCSMQLVPYSDTINLEASFAESGDYTIIVNDMTVTITV